MEINYCLKKGKGKGNLYLPCFVVTLFCRRALMSSRSYVAALLCRRALMSPRSYAAALLCRTLFCRALFLRRVFVAIPEGSAKNSSRLKHCIEVCDTTHHCLSYSCNTVHFLFDVEGRPSVITNHFSNQGSNICQFYLKLF
jgi:hypothetical protein